MIITLIIHGVICSCSSAQSVWNDRSSDQTLGLEFLQPNFTGSLENNSGYILTLSARLALSQSLHLMTELPFAHGGYSSGSFSHNQNILGNPYVGLEVDTRYSFLFMEFGTRIPIVSEEQSFAIDAGKKGDVDRFEAYTPNILQLAGALNLQPQLTPKLGFRLRVGPSFDIALKQTATSSTDLYLLYSEQLLYHDDPFYFGLGLTGRTILTNSRTNDRTVDVLELVAKVHAGRFLPGTTLRLPLDQSLSSLVALTYGFSVEVLL